MKYIKTFENLDSLKIGDFVKVDEETWIWIDSGLYGKINQTIFEIVEIDYDDDTYLLDILRDWFEPDKLTKASDIEVAQMKFNL